MSPPRLKLVSPAPEIPLMEVFGFVCVDGQIFICHKGEVKLALHHFEATDALAKWCSEISGQIPTDAGKL